MATIGPHLLGRIPSTPDDRDFRIARLREFDTGIPLLDAMAALNISHAAKATKAWCALATPLILGMAPPPAPPAPSPVPPPAPMSVVWSDSEPVLDQGDFGTCVGNGCAQWGNTLPIDDRFTEIDARKIYYEATVIDGQPDDPDAPGGGQQGSSVRSGVKALQARGLLTAYAFAKTINEIRQFVVTKGPVIMGTDWTADMFNPDSDGNVKPTGAVEGGHCYLLIGDDVDKSAAVFLNSWGASWGVGGRFKMLWSDVAGLLAQQGEACAAVQVK